MTNVIVPLDLFDDLVENVVDCLNKAKVDDNKRLIAIYEDELYRCNEIQNELSKDD